MDGIHLLKTRSKESARSNYVNAFVLVWVTITITSCQAGPHDKGSTDKSTVKDTRITHDTIFVNNNTGEDWQNGFGLTHDPAEDRIWFKPVNYYLDDKECSGLAADFYFGRLRPSDDGMTDELLKLATTSNKKLRPFYRWCLDKTIEIEDGALGEHTGIPARKYAEKFPKEFLEYMYSDTTKERYNNWVSSISYSGFYDVDDYNKPGEIKRRISLTMKQNCSGCDEAALKRIDRFATDCFH